MVNSLANYTLIISSIISFSTIIVYYLTDTYLDSPSTSMTIGLVLGAAASYFFRSNLLALANMI